MNKASHAYYNATEKQNKQPKGKSVKPEMDTASHADKRDRHNVTLTWPPLVSVLLPS